MTPPDAQPAWLKRLNAFMPSQETLAAHPRLKPIAHRLLEPALWTAQPEAVARGVAIGIFWAFAIPVAQIVVAAAHSVWWRANIPAAVGMTLITNPFTIGFWLWLAYKLGRLVLDAPPPIAKVEGASLFQWVASFGGPALLGMAIFAVVGAVSGYLVVKSVWAVWSWLDKRREAV